MLTVPSTHLVVICYEFPAGLTGLRDRIYPVNQTTELVGPKVAQLDNLVTLIPSVASFDLLEQQAQHAERVRRVGEATSDLDDSELNLS